MLDVSEGRPLPLGAHDCCDGFNFALFSRHATGVELVLFDDDGSEEPSLVVRLDPLTNRTGDVWHVLLRNARWGQAYAFRVQGPYEPLVGLRFDDSRLLVDPYALAVTKGPKGLLVRRQFDWEGIGHPRIPWSKTVIYEAHVRGLTIHPSAGVTHPGTYLGVIEKIPYLCSLGVTALELMPVQAFDGEEFVAKNPETGERLKNYWGYSPVVFFAPHEAYATQPGAQIHEFKTMVRELHRAGIEVILDVVFNHTAEGDETGPTFSFRGLDNPIYYLLGSDRSTYANYSGCGNTLNSNHPVVRSLVVDCLRYWVSDMRVDGFRFDLASILGRDSSGNLMSNPPLLDQIAEDPILRSVKLIAEAWDAAGAFQVGSFPGTRWSEWNNYYRDDIRRFWRGDLGLTGRLATRLCGSADLYQRDGERPVNSINFVTCHDGFTLADLVSYARKRNGPNGHGNRDGTEENYSANYGEEGVTQDADINALRLRQSKNMLGTLLLSRGVPMLLGGDEFCRGQRGNNNAYCQDNDTSWYDWSLVEQNAELVHFIQQLIALRKRYPALSAVQFYSDSDIFWFGPSGDLPQWDGVSRTLGCVIREDHGVLLCLLLNADVDEVVYSHPPEFAGRTWMVALNTAGKSFVGTPVQDQEIEWSVKQPVVVDAHSLLVLSSMPY